jgi:hypothetical protein
VNLTRMEVILASHCIDFCQGHARWVWHAIACLGPGPGQIKAQATQSLFSRSKYCGFQKMDVGGRVLDEVRQGGVISDACLDFSPAGMRRRILWRVGARHCRCTARTSFVVHRHCLFRFVGDDLCHSHSHFRISHPISEYSQEP